MSVVDASCVVGAPGAEAIGRRLASDTGWDAPHIVDVEVFGLIRRDHLRGNLDPTRAAQAIEDLETWPGDRFAHRHLLARAWDLRQTIRGWDAIYVALAEALGAILLTTDRRLASASGPTCRVEVVRPPTP